MTTKIAILRGINVGGRRKILMADLKQMLVEIGFKEPKTYIQSGNVFFQSDEMNTKLEIQIEKAIKGHFDLDVAVIVRDSNEIANSISKNPFYQQNEAIEKLHLTFLKDIPTKENLNSITTFNSGQDQFIIKGKDVFICCEGKSHESKLSNNFFEKKLDVGATTRNWKTVLKLLELSQ